MYPDQPVGIGTRLPARIKQELQRILCENKDIFAWSPSNMTRIPRELAEHKLNIHPRTFPVRQMKRVLTKDQNEAVTAKDHTGGAKPQRKTGRSRPVSSKSLPALTVPIPEETLTLYLATSHETVSFVLMVEREDQPIRQVLLRPKNSGRLPKWAIKLGEHDISYKPRSAVKGQLIADFLAECPNNTRHGEPRKKTTTAPKTHNQMPVWTLYTDDTSGNEGAGADLILTDLERNEITYALRFEFPTSNNESKYEVLIAGLELSIRLEVHHL
ncbi:hypothetical protein Tco_0590892 [Tanacetum coccineum]